MKVSLIFEVVSAVTLVGGFVFAIVQLRQHRADSDKEAALELVEDFFSGPGGFRGPSCSGMCRVSEKSKLVTRSKSGSSGSTIRLRGARVHNRLCLRMSHTGTGGPDCAAKG